MADLPLSGLLGLEKVIGWLGEQAHVFWRVLAEGPKSFIINQNLEVDEKIKKSTLFFVFTTLLSLFVSLPAIMLLGVDPNNQIIMLCFLILSLVDGILIAFIIHFYAKLFRGMGSITDTVSSIMYLTVYSPFVALAGYASYVNPTFRMAALEPDKFDYRKMSADGFDFTSMYISMSVMLFAYLFVWFKTGSVIKYVHSVSSVRGCFIILFSFSTQVTYMTLIEKPLIMEIIKTNFKQTS